MSFTGIRKTILSDKQVIRIGLILLILGFILSSLLSPLFASWVDINERPTTSLTLIGEKSHPYVTFTTIQDDGFYVISDPNYIFPTLPTIPVLQPLQNGNCRDSSEISINSPLILNKYDDEYQTIWEKNLMSTLPQQYPNEFIDVSFPRFSKILDIVDEVGILAPAEFWSHNISKFSIIENNYQIPLEYQFFSTTTGEDLTQIYPTIDIPLQSNAERQDVLFYTSEGKFVGEEILIAYSIWNLVCNDGINDRTIHEYGILSINIQSFEYRFMPIQKPLQENLLGFVHTLVDALPPNQGEEIEITLLNSYIRTGPNSSNFPVILKNVTTYNYVANSPLLEENLIKGYQFGDCGDSCQSTSLSSNQFLYHYFFGFDFSRSTNLVELFEDQINIRNWDFTLSNSIVTTPNNPLVVEDKFILISGSQDQETVDTPILVFLWDDSNPIEFAVGLPAQYYQDREGYANIQNIRKEDTNSYQILTRQSVQSPSEISQNMVVLNDTVLYYSFRFYFESAINTPSDVILQVLGPIINLYVTVVAFELITFYVIHLLQKRKYRERPAELYPEI